MKKWFLVAATVAIIAVIARQGTGWSKEAALEALKGWSDRLGIWAIPTYVAVHTLTLALCLPHAVFFEAGASILFGFLPALLCVFSAKVLAASFSFWFGRFVFKSSSKATAWAHNNKYFNILSRGVERDGWKFVLLARFSPIPSYVINYALAATQVRFLADFLFPTVIGCLPMILQNASVGSLAGMAVASVAGKPKTQVWGYVFPVLGVLSSVLITMRVKKYSAGITEASSDTSPSANSSSLASSGTVNPAYGTKKSE
ncbi:hypothetical protein BRARA_J00588 [Brassica rapa]|uniref:BnaA10g28260D protein n=3 Tax=Brassica TaxID=3705 RepID=A0A078IF04_BRANA|nr:uncharacterized protein LOC111207236 [Brassica napus]KAH0905980.1 hypothetical protein HID58_037807 [Brassica napus]RID40552.1 hypothetical protein BRARA_J00588 [Brassica rapa]CAF2318150.1 unnamed protein product [Brassica napus]CDY47954.1 BnaA10g28260D [Brassica napus]